MWEITKLALSSAWHFFYLVLSGRLHLSRKYTDIPYKINNHGTYYVFRNTQNSTSSSEERAVLVVGFRLKLLRNNRALHWLFQRGCMLTTPFWSGLRGFKVKLWMVDPKTKNYLGIYDWHGLENAQQYIEALTRVLKPLSVENTVWHKFPDYKFDTYLANSRVK